MDNKKELNRNIMLILVLALVLVLVGGGTMAWLSWTSENNTIVSITVAGGTLTIDGGGDITGLNMAPTTECNHENYAIKREINASAMNGTTTDMMAYIQLYTNSTLFPNVYKMENLEWVISSSDSDCTTDSNVLASGNFSEIDNSSDTSSKLNTPMDLITFKVPKGETINKTYYLYIWVNEDYTVENVGDTITPSIQGVEFTLQLTGKLDNQPLPPSAYQETILNGAAPVLESGMIPITLSDTGTVTTANITEEWYSYENKEWANAVLVDSSVRSTYINNDGTINGGLTIPEDKILAYYVWIPRYKYKLWITDPSTTSSPQTIDIVFESKDTSKSSGRQVGEYLTHPAFTFGNKELNGIWVGKFQTTGTRDIPTILPNESILRSYSGIIGEEESNEELKTSIATYIPNSVDAKHNIRDLAMDEELTNISKYFEVSLKYSGGTFNESNGEVTFSENNIYGLTANSDSHMMKNSEWGAVAYLSHSLYGINGEIMENELNDTLTGCGESSSSVTCGIPYGTPLLGENAYPQSTTGNISGIFDMFSGTGEALMGNYYIELNTSSFNIFPESKYYDSYLINEITSCTIEKCGGHALYETKNWYSNYNYIGNKSNQWIGRDFLFGYLSLSNDLRVESSGVSRMISSAFRSVIVDGN